MNNKTSKKTKSTSGSKKATSVYAKPAGAPPSTHPKEAADIWNNPAKATPAFKKAVKNIMTTIKNSDDSQLYVGKSRPRLAEGLALKEAFHFKGGRYIYREAWDGNGKSVPINRKTSIFTMVTIEDALASDWYVE